ncbi:MULTISPECIES: S-methyl-5-thioribose kinase [unclassified Treponema]|uniref:S-methyl-5-thioribose kinase n=1 Tax=unclassified Treponema TaxID=2638727 RepID=UPI0020A3FB35|nr:MULTISPECIES: S-methyl-5-thioribose kinase [unclassified Treponema]UTC66398.1 S-methyl-5-thioribose kinase [Treponema sp. OMZ 789]UTC69128.1 S-methyl-5-thioribose kinase [Treponema sp. OMZ 790]UTC71840.1 S-methyl-5-thioribose kinase [Treponema sp. OMZ 791]
MRFSSHYKMEGDDIIDYVFEHSNFFDSNENLVCEEIGDGNINYVYRIFDEETKKSLILKQADIQTRVRPDGYLNPNRSAREAEVLKLYNECAPDFSPKIIYTDPVMAAIIMEDIGSYSNLRTELMNGKFFYGIEKLIAHFIVDTSLASTDLCLGYQKKSQAAFKFYNPELCKITEELVFTHPYKDVRGRNILLPENAEWLKKTFYEDTNLISRVAALKEKFNNYPQGLIHGDLHSGSIFVKNENKETRIKIIDPEFAFYGPIAYDLGNVLAHLLFAQGYAKYSTFFADEQKPDFLIWIENAKDNLFKSFSAFAKEFLIKNIKDPIYKNEIFIDNYIEKIKIDAVSFCGTELNRRIIGSAKTPEITSIKKIENRVLLERELAELGCAMILNPEEILRGL